MEIKINLFIAIVVHGLIVSQSFSYLISLRNVQLQLDATAYTVFRKLTDASFQKNYRPIFYCYLVSSLSLLIFAIVQGTTPALLLAIVSFLAALADMLLAVKGNVPINNIINNWHSNTIPDDWRNYRRRWLSIFSWRQFVTITGFIALVVMAVFFN
ncbi:MAG: hypothetical protein H7Y31_01490 [Chitinophagaceae bacterium]|nr:hypothetical protein [Chitinophagaceae bacterium]